MSRITIDRGVHVVALDEPKHSRRKWLFLGIGALVAAGAVGTTLAASITLNTNNSTEFGQGVVTAGACDADIVVVPGTTYDPSETFLLSSITLQKVDLGLCTSKHFLVTARMGATGIATYAFDVNATSDGVENVAVTGDSGTWTGAAAASANPADGYDVTLTLTTGGIIYTNMIDRFTIETSG